MDRNGFAYMKEKFSYHKFRRVDFLGTIFLLAFSVLLVFALEEAGTRYQWSSPVIIVTITLALISGIAFVGWEYWLEKKGGHQEPTFPLSLLKGRILSGMVL